MSGVPRACERCYFGVRIFLRHGGSLSVASGAISTISRASGLISFTKTVVYNFLEVLGEK